MSSVAKRGGFSDDEGEDVELAMEDQSDPEGGLKGFHIHHHDDVWASRLLDAYHFLMQDSMVAVRVALLAAPFVVFGLFCLLVSDQLSSRIAFFALMMSIFFIGISLYFLCWILEKDTGTRQMRDISEPIKEGSEGFFMTQYGTIFKLAFVVAALLFFAYLDRSPAADSSPIHNFVGKKFTAFLSCFSLQE